MTERPGHEPGTVCGFALSVADFGPDDEVREPSATTEPGDVIAHHACKQETAVRCPDPC